jgi:2-oxoglutarate decarboxylase
VAVTTTAPETPDSAGFGANEWLVEELYQRFLADPNSVSPAWWDFFQGYRSIDPNHSQVPSNTAPPTVTPLASALPDITEPTPPVEISAPKTASAPPATLSNTPAPPSGDVETTALTGAAKRVVINMESSLTVPTATSVRTVPGALLIENRIFINNFLSRSRGGKVSFTHIIAWAIAEAIKSVPAMNASYAVVDGKPSVITYPNINLGLAIDLAKPDGSRQLLVPAIKNAQDMDFATFWASYDELVRKARNQQLTPDDFAGTTISVTNPGTIGTEHSVPRLMINQGAIVGVGALEYPAEWQGAAQLVRAQAGISRTLTLTSTYDHRIIQGAQSGEFLRRISDLLLGKDGFYEGIFASLKIPYRPYIWAQDVAVDHDDNINKVARVQALINSYRVRGHLIADVDPLVYRQRSAPDLTMASHGLSMWDLEREFPTGGFGDHSFMLLRDILDRLRDTYSSSIGVQYMHINDPEQRQWIQQKLERGRQKPNRDQQLQILRKLNAAEAFENFLQTKFVGQKRFSLEGSESTMVALDAIMIEAAGAFLNEVCIGMSHRGRLNVLVNIAGKSYAQVFREFEDTSFGDSVQGSGDVKYHLGTDGKYTSPDGSSVGVYLAANPSHLEAVDPVLVGIARSRQDQLGRDAYGQVLPLLIHGDAAFAGQGVVAETLNMSQLRGYQTGGTIHLIVNNQIGFTTAPHDGRSTIYASDVALGFQVPVFHVNGDDPEAVDYVARLAFEYRQKFARDVVIDLVAYRRRGHNEADDPSLTQPKLYELVEARRGVRKIYTESLIGRNDITVDEAEQALADYQQKLEQVFAETHAEAAATKASAPHARVEIPSKSAQADTIDTAVSLDLIEQVAQAQVNLREGFTPHPRLKPQLERRSQMIKDDSVDWAMAEAFAFGSLLADGRTVRISGQDVRRGTFGHRHAVIVDYKTGEGYKPLKTVAKNDARFFAFDSPLSEFGVVGFEYGYSIMWPEALVVWEAQFGDFVNGAQTILDEFISSGEQKWNQRSGVVLLLPHGMEGQGPDHSSGRIERFLSLCSQNNMIVSQPSTPASYFHLLRLQALNPQRCPLVVFTPKSLLRAKAATSPASAFTQGHFEPVLSDPVTDPKNITRVLLCSGKIVYEVLAQIDTRNVTDTAVVRLERFYPLPSEELRAALGAYPNLQEVVWVQDEPANQGAWPYLAAELPRHLGTQLGYRARPASASPATGSHRAHDEEQKALIEQIFA